MLQTWKHIFIGPSSALQDSRDFRTKKGQAEMNGLKKATARTIAYAALQVSDVHLICARSKVESYNTGKMVSHRLGRLAERG